FIPDWLARRAFPAATLDAIEAAIRHSETCHDGELRFAIEAGLHPAFVWRNHSPRERAVEVFSTLRVWDTAHNSGVLIYVQLVDRAIEIVADRGIAARVPQVEWDNICRRMGEAFRRGAHREGAVAAIAEITELLAAHFPSGAVNPDELPDRPAVL
ncbi:MAG: hypothetical protein RIR70_932, partial [Pseudomonadota bacterium]